MKKNFLIKLCLNKETVANLSNDNMSKIKGGRQTFFKTIDGNICSPNSMEGDCPSQNVCQTNDCSITCGNTTVNTSGQISCQGYIC